MLGTMKTSNRVIIETENRKYNGVKSIKKLMKRMISRRKEGSLTN